MAKSVPRGHQRSNLIQAEEAALCANIAEGTSEGLLHQRSHLIFSFIECLHIAHYVNLVVAAVENGPYKKVLYGCHVCFEVREVAYREVLCAATLAISLPTNEYDN